VLVHTYEEHGRDFVRQSNGQFAFAIWDAAARTLMLARDRVGIAPLHFVDQGPHLLFASEVKALLPAVGRPERLDLNGLDHTLTFWSTLSSSTLFPGIRRLPPGHLLVADARGVRQTPCQSWTFPDAGVHTTEPGYL
jgi:asparagine synthase (glutamine-hydrolysing)